jgi:CubicO group peptidase (beta-lactamase class C family)
MRRVAVLAFVSLLSPPSALAQQAQQPVLEEFIAAYAEAHDFNGSILIQAGQQVRYAESFGFANLPFRVPNTRETRYKIASVTKAFTAVLILQLQEQGRVHLDRTIGAYLPDYAGPARDRVTIHQLLNHTSGIQNYEQITSFDEAVANGMPNYQLPHTTDQLLARFSSGSLVHEPGTVFDYNNADYVILGKILEQIYEQPYEQVLQERILGPLGLTGTGVVRQSEIVDGMADTYFYREDLGRLANDLPVYLENWYAAGAMYSTPRDILAFANALFGERLLRKETLARMITPGLDDYGYGVWSYETLIDGRSHRVVKRPGRIMGAQSQLYHILDGDVTVVILSNTGTTDLDEFVAAIGKLVISTGS